MPNLSRTHGDKMVETLGDTASSEEMSEEMAVDPAISAFYEEHEEALAESHIQGLNRIIKNLPKLQRTTLDENEQIARLAVIALKLGLHDAAELVKQFVDTDPNFSWEDIKEVT